MASSREEEKAVSMVLYLVLWLDHFQVDKKAVSKVVSMVVTKV